MRKQVIVLVFLTEIAASCAFPHAGRQAMVTPPPDTRLSSQDSTVSIALRDALASVHYAFSDTTMFAAIDPVLQDAAAFQAQLTTLVLQLQQSTIDRLLDLDEMLLQQLERTLKWRDELLRLEPI